MITEPEFNKLRRDCTLALDRYFELAQQASEFVNDIRKVSMSVNERSGLLLHCRREDTARDEYLAARHRLLDTLAGTSKVPV
jgi:hypothetical protein